MVQTWRKVGFFAHQAGDTPSWLYCEVVNGFKGTTLEGGTGSMAGWRRGWPEGLLGCSCGKRPGVFSWFFMFLNVLGVDDGLCSVPEAEGCLPVAHGRVAHEPAAGLVVVAETADGDGGEALGPAIVYEFVERGGRCGEPGGSGGGGGGSFA